MAIYKCCVIYLKRRFSISSKNWADKRIQIYGNKREWIESVDVPHYINKRKKEKKAQEMGKTTHDQLIFTFVRMGNFIRYKGEFTKYINKKLQEHELLSQQYIQERVDILGPDLSAAQFILRIGGSVKFWRDEEWHNKKNPQTKLPRVYVPGYYIEGINAFGTKLYQEGLESLRDLRKLKWLSLKGLDNMDDFALDFISGHYGPQLEYLDLTGCTRITHYGLSCFYRFKKLRFLNLTGIEQPPEFKLACLMVEDLLPDLQIKGVDYSEYLEKKDKVIEGADVEEPILPSVQQ